ncbi:MAG: transglutaminase domain-containing protein [Solirubrobacteraceae bacterium]
MSAGAHTIHVPAGYRRSQQRDAAGADGSTTRLRAVVRIATFAALSLYGVQRWGTLLHPTPGARLLGLFALAVALAGGVPLLRRYSRVLAAVLAVGLILAAFPMAGLRWHWVVHVRIAVSAGRVGTGLQALPNVLVPYVGHSHAVRLVIVLGAAVLLLDAAAVMAFAGRAGPSFGDGRRAAAALPLLALAVVPSTLVHPQLPYLQGLILFALLAAFMWGERLRRDGASAALTVAAVAGVIGALVAPRLDTHRPWIDYRSWAGTLVKVHVDSFNWNQTYGPLRWPRSGHDVLTVSARSGDYWKAEDLDQFDGREWVSSPPAPAVTGLDPLPQPSAASQARWTQRVRVSITGLRTSDLIGAGYTARPISGLGGLLVPGSDPGTWMLRSALGPGASYTVSSYSPHPSASELRAVARQGYLNQPTAEYRTLNIPQQQISSPTDRVEFPRFHRGWVPAERTSQLAILRSSPYAGAYALAQQLERNARTPFQFVTDVKQYLSKGFTYDEHPPAARFPLESFLFKHKLGYCQQFSGAMAMLLRMGGVPARVSAGFTSGAFANESHTWQVADTDAHAWVEAWFPEYGWVRFDPTPATAPARGGTAPDPIIKGVGSLKGTTPGGSPHGLGQITTATAAGHRSPGSSGPSPWLVVAGLLGLALVGRLGWVLLAPAGSTEQLLAELRRAMARTGRPLTDDATLATLEHRFGDSPAAAGYVRALRLERYGARAGRPTAVQRRALRRQLAFGLGAMGGLRALWALPPRLRATSHGKAAADRS